MTVYFYSKLLLILYYSLKYKNIFPLRVKNLKGSEKNTLSTHYLNIINIYINIKSLQNILQMANIMIKQLKNY